jgi:putative aldouronate transport system permease protein
MNGMERMTLTRKLMKFGSTGQIVTHLLFIIIVVLCLYPLALVIGISFTDETSLALHGFKLVPLKTSLNAYSFVLK